MFSWFKSLFKGKKMAKTDHRHKKLPRFKYEEFLNIISKHSLMDDLQGKTYRGPSEPNQRRYIEDFHYFCAIFQHALMDGKRIFLPGIGTFQLCRRKPHIIKRSGLFHCETKEEGRVYLKAYILPEMRKYYDNAKVDYD